MLNIEFVIEEINNGKTLKDISTSLGFSPGYVSNYLKNKKIKLPNENIILQNNIKKRVASVIKPLNKDKLIKDIHNNLSSSQIGKKYNCSNVHVKRWVCKNLFDYYKKLIDNGLTNRNTSALGRSNLKWKNNKGKTYEEIYGIEKAKLMREKRSAWLKQNNIRKYATRISKPQATLFAIVKNYFPNAEIEFEIDITKDKKIYLDIAIPDKKICIEYDGIYWHEKNENTISMKDKERDNFLFLKGWRVYRIRSHKNLNEQELKSAFFKLELLHE